jgi:hypothetical protein
MTMTTLAVRAPPVPVPLRLDHVLLRRAFLVMGLALVVFAPFTPDPIEFAVGGFVPWLVLRIVGTPTLPAAVVYYLIWQWLQVYARTLVSVTDGEEMARGLYGPWVVDAYWYMLASIVALALAIRTVLGSARPPSPRQATAHLAWRPVDLFQFYLASVLVSSGGRFLSDFVHALDQPMEPVVRIKFIALLMLFGGVLSAGRGVGFLLAAVMVELVIGFSGLLGDFRSVFIMLFISALAVRIRWTAITSIAVAAAAVALVVLGLFWTSVKAEYREVATGSDDSQNIKMSLDTRLGYLGGRVASAGDIDWSLASYALLYRLAYVDIFGSVIGVKLVSPEQGSFRQWSDALGHVFQPRFLFPGKQALSDTEVFIRLARGDASEQMRMATSISVGYMAENYVDLGFPGMLAGVFMIGLVVAAACRYFMALPLPWLVREGIVLAFIYAIAANGVEISLPKLLGATVMTFIVYALLSRFVFPVALRWLDTRAAVARHQEMRREQARAAAHHPLLK